jgi:type IV pilus assembly protein PilA
VLLRQPPQLARPPGPAAQALRRGEAGLTLVELLVVMLILGLLAAIAIPSFFNQRDKAHDAKAKTAVATAQKAIEVYATANEGSYGGAAVADLRSIEKVLVGADLSVTSTAGTYTVEVASPGTGNRFSISRRADGAVDYPCTTAGSSGCPASGVWAG